MSLGDFLTEGAGGSWADEVEETYVMTGTQQLPPSDRPRMGGTSSWADRGYSIRESIPATLPDKPPYTAHLGNLSYDATVDTVTEFFEGCEVVSVRIIEDRDMQRPKGFGYVEFANVEGLKKALTLDGESFQGRMIKIKIADPPRGGDSGRGDFIRDMGDWTRKGPLEPAPTRGPPRGGPDFGERRLPRDPNAPEPKAARDLTWERRGPLAPLPQEERSESREGRHRPAPEGLGERGGSSRGRQAPAWGEGRPEGSGPPRREYSERPERPERPERAPTAAEQDNKWRERMRPDAPQTPREGSAPGSPVAPAAAPAPAGRPRLNLQKRTVSEATDAASTTGSDSKASPFGAARPIDTAAREKEVEEKRQQALREKREADEKAKEERRLAKEAAAKAEAEGAKAEAPSSEAGETKPEEAKGETEAAAGETQQNGGATSEQNIPIRTREPRDAAANPNAKPRPFDAGNWRSASGDGQRGGGRGGARGGGRGARGGGAPRQDVRSPRANGPPSSSQQPASPASPATAEPETPTQDEDGWVTVPTGKKGRQGRPLA